MRIFKNQMRAACPPRNSPYEIISRRFMIFQSSHSLIWEESKQRICSPCPPLLLRTCSMTTSNDLSGIATIKSPKDFEARVSSADRHCIAACRGCSTTISSFAPIASLFDLITRSVIFKSGIFRKHLAKVFHTGLFFIILFRIWLAFWYWLLSETKADSRFRHLTFLSRLPMLMEGRSTMADAQCVQFT